MVFLTAVVTLIGIVSVLNLVLVYGVIRRLRQHTTLLSDVRLPAGTGVTGLVPGSELPPTRVTALDGATYDAAEGPALVGFFSPGCATCREQVGTFTAYARDRRSARGAEAWAVVIGETGQVDDLVASLTSAAHVIVTADPNSAMPAAFQVQGMPAYFEVAAGGKVRAVGVRVDDLAVAV